MPIFRLISLIFVLLWAGCDRDPGQPLGAEIDESEFTRGQKLVRQGRHQEALASYLRLIEKRGNSAPESHLEVGILYLQQIKDPLAAIYHLRKYLERQPNSPQSPQVRGLVDSAKREFARTLPANPLENQSERLNMLDQLGRLQRENDQLKEALARSRGNVVPPRVDNNHDVFSSPLSVAPIQVEAQEQTPVLREPVRSKPTPPATNRRLHTVEKGDTLFVLAQRYYDNRSKWRDIYAANHDVMPNENSLQIGMVLKIP